MVYRKSRQSLRRYVIAPILLSVSMIPIFNSVYSQDSETVGEKAKKCAESTAQYLGSEAHQNATECLLNFTNPDVLVHGAAILQAKICAINATLNVIKHNDPDSREAIETIQKAKDLIDRAREFAEHPDPNMELFYEAANYYLDQLDERTQSLADKAKEDCNDASHSAYRAAVEKVSEAVSTATDKIKGLFNFQGKVNRIEGSLGAQRQSQSHRYCSDSLTDDTDGLNQGFESLLSENPLNDPLAEAENACREGYSPLENIQPIDPASVAERTKWPEFKQKSNRSGASKSPRYNDEFGNPNTPSQGKERRGSEPRKSPLGDFPDPHREGGSGNIG